MSRTEELTYKDYLELDKLLSLQHGISEPEVHDEFMFIVAHQTMELWFKVILHELDEVYARMESGEVRKATHLLERVVKVEEHLLGQFEIIESMKPTEFLRFRDELGTASAFESRQFREIEFLSGTKDEKYLRYFERHLPEDYEKLKKRFDSPSIWDAFRGLLDENGYKIQVTSEMSKEEIRNEEVEALVDLYSSEEHPEIRELAEALMEHDEAFWLWRHHHVAMVERMIGRRYGTGARDTEEVTGSMMTGVEYLESTLDKRFYPPLWEARTVMESSPS